MNMEEPPRAYCGHLRATCSRAQRSIDAEAENARLKKEIEGLKLFIACNYKGTFANCGPKCCVRCHEEGKVK